MTSEKTANYGWRSETPHTAAYLSGAILEVLEQSGAKTILDAGCGNGALAGHLAQKGYSVIGVDADEGGIAIARSHFPNVRFEVGTFDGCPPGTFEAVCSTEVIEHLYAPHFLARYSFEALKPGGLLIVSTPYHGYLKNLVLSLRKMGPSSHCALVRWAYQVLEPIDIDSLAGTGGVRGHAIHRRRSVPASLEEHDLGGKAPLGFMGAQLLFLWQKRQHKPKTLNYLRYPTKELLSYENCHGWFRLCRLGIRRLFRRFWA